MIAHVHVPLPVEYLPTGDHALLMAWVSGDFSRGAVLCLEDGRAVEARLEEFKFDYRFDHARGVFVDVSHISEETGEEDDAHADQEDADDGSQGVQGQVSAPD